LKPVLTKNGISIKEVWKNFAERLQHSIQTHLYTMREVAESTHHGRHLLLVNVEILEFDLKMLAYQLIYPYNGMFIDKALQARIIRKCEDIKNTAEIYRINNGNSADEEFKDGIYKRLNNLRENCSKVAICADLGTDTIEIEKILGIKKLEIQQAMKTVFENSGHWYECPKGHPFTVEESDSVSRCPDCNAEIN